MSSWGSWGLDDRTAAVRRVAYPGRYHHTTNADLKPGDTLLPASARGYQPSAENGQWWADSPYYDPNFVYMYNPEKESPENFVDFGTKTYEVKPVGKVRRDPEYANNRENAQHCYIAPRAVVVRRVDTGVGVPPEKAKGPDPWKAYQESLGRPYYDPSVGDYVTPGQPHTASTDGIRYAHIVEADVAEDLVRLAMAWDEWAPQINGGCEGGCDHDRMTMGEYSISHPDGTGPQVGDLLPGIKGRSLLQFNHDTDQNGNPEIYVSGIHVDEGHRRDGIAEALMRRLHRDHPDTPINPGFMTDDGQGLLDGLKKRIPEAGEALVPRFAAFDQDLIDRLRGHYLDWYGENGDERLEGHHPDFGSLGPFSNWHNIEQFMRSEYPAAHRGLSVGLEGTGRLLDTGFNSNEPGRDNCTGCYGSGRDRRTGQACERCGGTGVSDEPLAYETGPDAVATHGYDPKEVAAGMLLLHNQSQPQRGDMLDMDIDRMSDIAQKRFDMQRAYEQRNARTAMPAPTPRGMTFHYYPDDEALKAAGRPRGDKPLYTPCVEARNSRGRHVGYLEWYGPDDQEGGGLPPGEINMVEVHPTYRRRGVATAMLDFARQHDPSVHHSLGKTELGHMWADYEESRHREAARRTARAPWNPAGGAIWRGLRVRWTPQELVHLHELHDAGHQEALAHAILNRVERGNVEHPHDPPGTKRDDGGGLGVFWTGDDGVSHGYSRHGGDHGAEPGDPGPFENVQVRAEGYDPDDEWTPYDDSLAHDEEPNDFLNADRETDLVMGAPLNVTHVRVNAPDGTVTVPLHWPRPMTAMAVLPEGHHGPAEPYYDPDHAPWYDPEQDAVPPDGATWYHVTPHKLKPGTVLTPGGGDSFFDDEGFYDHENTQARKRWVWTEHDLNDVHSWMDTIFDSHLRGYATHPRHWPEEDVGKEPPLYVYRIQPHHPPQPWESSAGQGWVTGAATVLGEHMRETGPWMDRVRKERGKKKQLAAVDPHDAQEEAVRDVMHLHHYIEEGEHPDGVGTVLLHPHAHHPALTNHWAAEIIRPTPYGPRFGIRAQAATGDYVDALTGTAEGSDPGAHHRLQVARDGLRVELQHAGHFEVPDLSQFSRLPRESDAMRLAAVNPRHDHGMEVPPPPGPGSSLGGKLRWLDGANARLAAYTVNCQRACLALDGRHRGLNVEARPNYINHDHDPLGSDEQWTDADLAGLWHDQHGNQPGWIDASDHFQFATPGTAHWDAMTEHIGSWGRGARALIAMTQANPTDPTGGDPFRHVIMARVGRDGRVRYVDPQIARADASDWRGRVMYGGHPKLFTAADRDHAASLTDDHRVKTVIRNQLYSPLRYLRIDDAQLSPHAARHLVDRGSAGAYPIVPAAPALPDLPDLPPPPANPAQDW